MLLRLYSRWSGIWLRLAGGRRRRVEAAGYSVVVHELGPPDAPPWLLLHGLGATAASWMAVLRSARRRRRMLVPELSALGGTRGPEPAVPVAAAAGVLTELIEQIPDVQAPTVMGMSLGAWMAVRLALAQPRRVQRLVLIDAAGWHDQDWEHVRELVSVRTEDDVERLYQALFVRTPLLLRWSRRTFLEAYTSPAVRSILERTSEDDTFTADDLARLSIPTGLIWGEQDGLFPPRIGEAMAASLRHARLEVVPRCGHGLHWECPRRFAAAVERAAAF